MLVNGSPTLEFQVSKGVRQGDPLSPFLFIIAMEGLHVAMKTALDKHLFHGITLPNNGPTISHLMYADDVMFVGEWSISNVLNLKRLLRCFHLSSGLKVNYTKSKVFGFGIDCNDLSRMANILNCESGFLPFTYLGVPIGANMNLSKHWNPIVDKFKSRLNIWKAKTLSFGGRLTLIKSVLGSLSLYYFSIFKAPKKVIGILEGIRRNFLWSGGENKRCIKWVA